MRRVTQFYDLALKPSGLRVTQYSILAHVAAQGDGAFGESLTGLAARLDMERTTLTRNLSPLVKAGLVESARGPDRRSRSVRVTAAGRRLLAEAAPLWREAESGFRRTVGEGDAAQLRALAGDALAQLTARLVPGPEAREGG